MAPDGDTAFVVAEPTLSAVVVLDRSGRALDTLGIGVLQNPRAVQPTPSGFHVSDVDGGRPLLVELSRDGSVRRRIELDGVTARAHQFAVLPDGAVVVETQDQRLVALRGDSIALFAVVDVGPRPSLLVAAGGGVLHAVPDKWISLYNSFGRIRWRIEWPWLPTAYVSAIAIDSQGRVHVLAGISPGNTFNVYTLAAATGEVFRWFEGAEQPSFVVDRFGELTPAGPRWTDP